MKKVIPLLLIVSIFSSCNVFRKSLSEDGKKEKAVVAEMLQIMVESDSANKKLRKFIAPSYYETNNLNEEKILIDNFSPVDFSIDSYNKYTGCVVTRIWGENKSWVHRLTFLIVIEDKKLYVMPSKHSKEYIKPWYKDERNVE